MIRQNNNPSEEYEGIYLNEYYLKDFDFLFTYQIKDIVLTNEKEGVEKIIVDRRRNILDFPGVEYCGELRAELGTYEISPCVKYESYFERCGEGCFRMVWTVRPDGRYWMDEFGFGGEDYEAVTLYSVIDSKGQFLFPFKLYEIGYKRFDIN